ncbi:AbrB/MazE/SpoVT family DNA-binding domain-containing protein [Candidatus Woesearchaeota archaeon]|nr:AbrB/MazE/SpoVT family DNA-binding domain-containing protein [Candidatus Woesearchaeota archaeon]
MKEKIELGTVSARGQICIPNNIREEMGLKEGNKILFFLSGDSLIMKKVQMKTFEELTRPLKEAKKKIEEKDVTELIHKMRKNEGNN